jgi:hypothetical protein
MRILLAFPLLMIAGCDVDNDAANDQLSVKYDQERIRDAAAATARGARDVARGVGNVAVSTGQAVKNEVGDVDVDVDVTRNRTDDKEGQR